MSNMFIDIEQRRHIRYFAVVLLLFTSGLHLLPIFENPNISEVISLLIFGILYLIIGVMLLYEVKTSTFFGILYPLLGLLGVLIVNGITFLTPYLLVLCIIDISVIICCSILIINKKQY